MYTYLIKEERNWKSRARACVLIRYSNQTKRYQKKEIIQTKHVRFDETKLGYKKAEDATSQVLFEFYYADSSEEEQESGNTQADIQEQSKDKYNKRQWKN